MRTYTNILIALVIGAIIALALMVKSDYDYLLKASIGWPGVLAMYVIVVIIIEIYQYLYDKERKPEPKFVVLKIKASDITSSYYNSIEDCAIARAVERANEEYGINMIFLTDTIRYKDRSFNIRDLDQQVRRMYGSKAIHRKYIYYGVSLTPRDFEYELKLT